VLLIGHGTLPPSYKSGPWTLPRRPFLFLPTHAPIARRVFGELALGPKFRRRSDGSGMSAQIVLPDRRFTLFPGAALDAEIAREFGDQKRHIDEFHSRVLAANDELDALTSRDLVWPPGGFFEKRELARALESVTLARADRQRALDELMPESNPFRVVVNALARFSDGMDPDHQDAARVLRHYGHWLRGPALLDEGEAALHTLVHESLVAHGAEIRATDRVEAIVLRRGEVSGVRLRESGLEVGTGFVCAGIEIRELARLLPNRRPFEELFERLGEPQPRHFRYTVNFVLDKRGVLPGMSSHVFLRSAPSHNPPSATEALWIEQRPLDDDHVLWCVEALIPRRELEGPAEFLDQARRKILDAIRELAPFVDRHLVWIDSPHDMRDAEDVKKNALVPSLEPWSRGPRTMRIVYGYPVSSALGFAAFGARTPVKKLLLASEQVVPGLGLEGELLSAWSCARIVTRSASRRWMRRRISSRAEL
jgi:phytoene dehydrogenase-like protein